jgi:hypothetical protein
VVLSDVVATIQAVAGADYAVVTGLTVVAFSDPPSTVKALTELTTTLSTTPLVRIPVPLASVDQAHTVHPAQIAILSPDIADSLVLTQIVP